MCCAFISPHQFIANFREWSEVFPTSFGSTRTSISILTRARYVSCRLEHPSASFVIMCIYHGNRAFGILISVIGKVATELGAKIDVVRAGYPFDIASAITCFYLLVTTALFRKLPLAASFGHGVGEACSKNGVQKRSLADC